MFIKFCNSLAQSKRRFLFKQYKLLNLLLGAVAISMLFSPAVALAQTCVPGSFTWNVTAFGAHLDTQATVQRIFDGQKSYTGDQLLRMHQPGPGVPNELTLAFSSARPAGTGITLYMENDDAEAMIAATLAVTVASYNNTYAPGGTAPDAALFARLDRDGSGAITVADFNIAGATSLNAASGDFSPLGVTLSFYNGNPAAGGVLVNRSYSPINTISPTVYSFTTVSTGAFTHVGVVSWADNNGDDPRVIELEVNNTPNNGTNTITTTCLQLAKAWGANSIAGNVASIGATTGGANNTAAFTSTASTNTSSTSVAVSVGNTITFPAETMSPGTLANYDTVRSCTSNGGATTNALSNTNGQQVGTLLIGAGESAESIVCTYTNTRKTLNLTLAKTWVGANLNDAVGITATGLTTLASVANAASETDTGGVQTVRAGDAITLAESFTTGNSAIYTSVLSCTGTSGLSGSVLTVGGADTAIVCTFTNTRRIANLIVTKNDAKTTTVSGDTNTYSIVVTNNGPLAADNAVVTDPGGVSGLTCSTVSCAAAGGAVCPAAPTVAVLQSPGLTIPTLPNTGSVTLTLTCSVSATGV